jgi:large subunit ribosomal protein L28
MSRTCELTGVKPLFGQNVSHSNRKTKRKFLPNLCNVTLVSDSLNKKVRLRISAGTLRTIDNKGGLDGFLLSRSSRQLTTRASELRKTIEIALAKKNTNK